LFDKRIINPQNKFEAEEAIYPVKEVITNYDYDQVMTVLSKLEFTPKDSKQF